MRRSRALLAALAVTAAACGPGSDAALPDVAEQTATTGAVSTARTQALTAVPNRESGGDPMAPPNQLLSLPTPTFASTEPPAEPVPSPGSMLPREIVALDVTPFAVAGDLVLMYPSTSVEMVGFHESNHDGAQQMEVLDSSVDHLTMESRQRGTGSRSAADIVVEPGVPIVAPVTGTVVRAGTYTLYCDYADHYAVIEPDGLPGWEVKILHFLDLAVAAGERVEAGLTVLGSGPRPLAFRSQVDDVTAAPSWPHVHIEVVDTSIPDRPSGRGC